MHAYQEMPSVRFFEIKGILPTRMSLARKMETVQHKVNYKDHHQFQTLKEVIVQSHHLGMTEVQRVEEQRAEVKWWKNREWKNREWKNREWKNREWKYREWKNREWKYREWKYREWKYREWK